MLKDPQTTDLSLKSHPRTPAESPRLCFSITPVCVRIVLTGEYLYTRSREGLPYCYNSPSAMAYDNPHGLIASAVIVQTLVLVMIGSRFVSHRMKGLTFHTSDYLIIVAGVLSTALAIEQIYCTCLTPRSSRCLYRNCVASRP